MKRSYLCRKTFFISLVDSSLIALAGDWGLPYLQKSQRASLVTNKYIDQFEIEAKWILGCDGFCHDAAWRLTAQEILGLVVFYQSFRLPLLVVFRYQFIRRWRISFELYLL